MALKNIPERNEINNNYKWDLTQMIKNDDEWEKLYNELEGKISGYEKFKGHMGESLETFRNSLEYDMNISRETEKIYTYAHLRSDEDKTNQFTLAMYQRSVNLYTRISELSSFMTPEIQEIDEKIVLSYMDNPSMRDYRFYLEKILKFKPHTLSKEIEQVIAMMGEVAHAPSQIFSQLDNADMTFGTISDREGNEVELSHGNFSTFLQD